MVLLRRVIGDALRARRQGQHRTLREVSTAANVSLGYLSEIERGQKEASSELLAAICDALGAQLSDVLRQVSDSLAVEEMELAVEEIEDVLVPGVPARRVAGGDGEVSVSVRHDTPLRTTLKATRSLRGDDRDRERDVVYA
jgi:transcriptional regulator with XRE-family HTH domain